MRNAHERNPINRHCSTCSCSVGEEIPQPATSNDAHRRAVIAGAKAVIDSKRRARTTVPDSARRTTTEGESK